MRRTDKGFRAAGARKAVDPENGQIGFGFHSVGDFEVAHWAKTQGNRRHRTEFQEITSTDASAAQHFVLGFLWVEHGYILLLVSVVFKTGPWQKTHPHGRLLFLPYLFHTEAFSGMSVNRMIAVSL